MLLPDTLGFLTDSVEDAAEALKERGARRERRRNCHVCNPRALEQSEIAPNHQK